MKTTYGRLDQLEEIKGVIDAKLPEFFAQPTGARYHLLKNKLAEYYSVAVAQEEENGREWLKIGKLAASLKAG